MNHIPVLLKEVIEILNPKPGPACRLPAGQAGQAGNFFIDGTVGSGGHAAEIMKRIGSKGKFLGIDWDENNLNSLVSVHGNFADLPKILEERKLGKADGLLLDLGMSSEQLERSGRGFSFLRDEPLIMRYQYLGGRTSEILTAAEVINSFSEKELADIFFKYGEERFSRRIARKIIEERRKKRILTTFELVEIIKKAVPKNYERGRIHPATRTFLALRIFTNQELVNLEKLLNSLGQILKVGGRIAVISFNSLEDRLVKNYFRERAKNGEIEILTKKPIRPTIEEIKQNPRSRSAKLRAAILTKN